MLRVAVNSRSYKTVHIADRSSVGFGFFVIFVRNPPLPANNKTGGACIAFAYWAAHFVCTLDPGPYLEAAESNGFRSDCSTSCHCIVADTDSEEDEQILRQAAQKPQTVFQQQCQDGVLVYYAVWNCVLFNDTPGSAGREEQPKDLKASLQSVRCHHRFWAVILSQGGHFAGAVFQLNPQQRQGHEWAIAIRHKTFNRCISFVGADPIV
jgi:hypothetical protein